MYGKSGFGNKPKQFKTSYNGPSRFQSKGSQRSYGGSRFQGSGTTRRPRPAPMDPHTYQEAQEAAKGIEKFLWKSTMTLIRLPGGYPVCYATGSGTHLVTSYSAWNNYKKACHREAWSIAKNEANQDDLQEGGAPFTWGFRAFPSGEAFSSVLESSGEMSRCAGWVWDFVTVNIFPYECAFGKFKDGLMKLAEANGMEDKASVIIKALESDKRMRNPEAAEALLAFLVFPEDDSTNYTPGELSEFYKQYPVGDTVTSNLLFDQIGEDRLRERIDNIESQLEELKESQQKFGVVSTEAPVKQDFISASQSQQEAEQAPDKEYVSKALMAVRNRFQTQAAQAMPTQDGASRRKK